MAFTQPEKINKAPVKFWKKVVIQSRRALKTNSVSKGSTRATIPILIIKLFRVMVISFSVLQ